LQHEQALVLVPAPFEQYSGNFSAPFHENQSDGEADYQLPYSVRVFYRFSYLRSNLTLDAIFVLVLCYRAAEVTLLSGISD